MVAEQRSHRCKKQLLQLLYGGEPAAPQEMAEVALRIGAHATAWQGAAPRCWRSGVAVIEPLQGLAEVGNGAMVQWGVPAGQRQLPSQDYGNGLSGLITQNRSMIASAKPLQLTASTWGSISRARS